MAYVDTWRTALTDPFATFQALLPHTRHIDKKHGVMAAALLWPIKDTYAQDHIQEVLSEICRDALKPMLRALEAWDTSDPLIAAEWLHKRAADRPDLQTALDRLLLFFMDEIVAAQFIKRDPVPQEIDISGTVQGGIVNIGGTQYFWGDVIVNVTYIQENVVTCPPLPDDPREFGGRQTEFDALVNRLKAGQTTAITAAIQGLGGIGKTTLAKKLARHLHQTGAFRTVVWTEVNQTPNPRALLTAWAKYGESHYQDDITQPLTSLISAAKERLKNAIDTCPTCDTPQALIILDDIWEDGIETVQALDQARPEGAILLITTRFENVANTLNITPQKLGYLATDADRIDFLRAYLPSDLDEGLLKGLGASLGGYPLALKLACARAKDTKQYGSLAKAIEKHSEQYQKALQTGDAFGELALERGDSKELNLSASLRLSYEELAPRDQQCWRALGVLAPSVPFATALLQALWETDEAETANICNRLLLRSLIEGSIPETESEDGAMIYTQHLLLRAYARALLTEAGEMEAIFGRYAHHIIEVCEQFYTLPPEQWNDVLTPQYPHILYVGDELVRQPEKGTTDNLLRVLNFAANISRYLFRRREIQRLSWLEMGLQSARTLQTDADPEQMKTYQSYEKLFLNDIGLAWDALGERRKSLSYYEQKLLIDRALGDRGGEATTLTNIGSAWNALGETHKALEYLEQALPIRRAVGDRDGEAATLYNIGSAWSALGETLKALEYYEQARVLFQAVGDRGGEATTLNNVGRVWDMLAETLKALEYYEQARLLFQAVGDRGGEATTLNNIGRVWRVLGETRKALEHYAQAMPLFQAVVDRGGEATTLNNMSYIYFQSGDLEKTVIIQQQIITVLESIGAVSQQAASLYNIAIVYQRMGRFENAIQSAQAGKEILVRYNLPQSAWGATIAQYDSLLAQLQGQTNEQPPAPSTLPQETIQTLAQNTYAVKTDASDHLTEWRENLTNVKTDWAGRGVDWSNEIAFLDALLAILNDESPTLPADNPYANAVQQIITLIQQHREGGES